MDWEASYNGLLALRGNLCHAEEGAWLPAEDLGRVWPSVIGICPERPRGDFPGGPVVKTPCSNEGAGQWGEFVLIPGQGATTRHASRPKNQNIKWKQYFNKPDKEFKNGPHQNNLFFFLIKGGKVRSAVLEDRK